MRVPWKYFSADVYRYRRSNVLYKYPSGWYISKTRMTDFYYRRMTFRHDIRLLLLDLLS